MHLVKYFPHYSIWVFSFFLHYGSFKKKKPEIASIHEFFIIFYDSDFFLWNFSSTKERNHYNKIFASLFYSSSPPSPLRSNFFFLSKALNLQQPTEQQRNKVKVGLNVPQNFGLLSNMEWNPTHNRQSNDNQWECSTKSLM